MHIYLYFTSSSMKLIATMSSNSFKRESYERQTQSEAKSKESAGHVHQFDGFSLPFLTFVVAAIMADPAFVDVWRVLLVPEGQEPSVDRPQNPFIFSITYYVMSERHLLSYHIIVALPFIYDGSEGVGFAQNDGKHLGVFQRL